MAALGLALASPALAQRVVPGALVVQMPSEPVAGSARVVAQEAVVTLAPAQAKKRTIPAGTVLARVTGERLEQPVWCDVREPNGLDRQSIDCLADTDEDGRPDRLALGLTAEPDAPFTVVRLVLEDGGAAPVSVRAAKSEERPTAMLGPSFRKAEAAKPGLAAVAQAQARVATPLPGAGVAKPDRKTRFQIEQALAERPPLLPVGPARPGVTDAKRGDVLLSVPVVHGITGRLKNIVDKGAWLPTGEALAPGQPVFGVPMTARTYNWRASVDNLVWCAPRKRGPRDYSTICLPTHGLYHRWIEIPSPMFVSRLDPTGNEFGTNRPEVELEPVDFGVPMTLVYRFGGVKKDRVLINVTVETDFGATSLPQPEMPKLTDGAAFFSPLGGGLVRLTPAADGKTVIADYTQPFRRADGSRP